MSTTPSQTFSDQLLSFTIPERDCRGRLVRLGPVLEDVLGTHDYPTALTHCLAEALVLTVLMGGLLKEEGDQLTLQAQSKAGSPICWSAITTMGNCAAILSMM